MIKFQIWWNEEVLPSKAEPQKILYCTIPYIHQWFISAPIYIGVNVGLEHIEYACVILGFGIIWNKNWDI